MIKIIIDSAKTTLFRKVFNLANFGIPYHRLHSLIRKDFEFAKSNPHEMNENMSFCICKYFGQLFPTWCACAIQTQCIVKHRKEQRNHNYPIIDPNLQKLTFDFDKYNKSPEMIQVYCFVINN